MPMCASGPRQKIARRPHAARDPVTVAQDLVEQSRRRFVTLALRSCPRARRSNGLHLPHLKETAMNTRMTMPLPKIAGTYIRATNDDDAAAFIALFADDAVVN